MEEDQIKDEVTHLSSYRMEASLEQTTPMSCIYKHMYTTDLQIVFPNMFIALRPYLTLPITNYEAERAFSKLSLVKTTLSSSLKEGKLNSHTFLSSKHDITNSLDFSQIIYTFATQKIRKQNL